MRYNLSGPVESAEHSMQGPDAFEAAVALAWADPDLDPSLTNNAARTPSGQGCCACYGGGDSKQ